MSGKWRAFWSGFFSAFDLFGVSRARQPQQDREALASDWDAVDRYLAEVNERVLREPGNPWGLK